MGIEEYRGEDEAEDGDADNDNGDDDKMTRCERVKRIKKGSFGFSIKSSKTKRNKPASDQVIQETTVREKGEEKGEEVWESVLYIYKKEEDGRDSISPHLPHHSYMEWSPGLLCCFHVKRLFLFLFLSLSVSYRVDE